MLKHLADKGVPFVQKDLPVDPKAGAELAALGVLAAPATVIDGAGVTGFEPAKMDRLLGEGAGNKLHIRAGGASGFAARAGSRPFPPRIPRVL